MKASRFFMYVLVLIFHTNVIAMDDGVHMQASTAKDPIIEVYDWCNISGLQTHSVLKALYQASKTGRGWAIDEKRLDADMREIVRDSRKNIGSSLKFSYVAGKPLHVCLRHDIIDVTQYNRLNGAGAAQQAIQALRNTSRLTDR